MVRQNQAINWGSHVLLYKAPKNGGFAYGCNMAKSVIAKLFLSEYWLLLNSDAFVDPGAMYFYEGYVDQKSGLQNVWCSSKGLSKYRASTSCWWRLAVVN